MTANKTFATILIAALLTLSASAYCPLDHLFIGCNEDGIPGTDDDTRLFVDCRHKYRNVPAGNWHYPLNQSGSDPCDHMINEPGFDEINDGTQFDHPLIDPNRSLEGTRNSDYRIMVRCVSISDSFTLSNLSGTIALTEPGDEFNLSSQGSTHVHLWYTFSNDSPDSPPPYEPLWITLQLYDAMGKYEHSPKITIVFAQDPLAGDLFFDNHIDHRDLAEFTRFWLADEASIENDYYERADINQDGRVNLSDYSELATNWLTEFPGDG